MRRFLLKRPAESRFLYAGMGEKLSDLEQFYPDRMASRILGMGDVLSLIEKAQDTIDESKAKEMEQKLRKAQFGFDDYLESMNQMKNMGGISKILSMMPGMGGAQMKQIEDAIDEKQMARIEAMILSMTPKERANPDHPESVPQAQNCRWRRRGHQRGEQAGEAV